MYLCGRGNYMNSNRSAVELTTPIRSLPGIGPKRLREFEAAGFRTVEDLLYHFPLRYEDRRNIRTIASLMPKETVLVSGTVVEAELVKTRRRGFTIVRAYIEDPSGGIEAMWFNQPWLADKLQAGKPVSLYGQVDYDRKGRYLQISNAKIDDESENTATGIVPVYQRVGKVGGWVIKKIIGNLFSKYTLSISGSVPQSLRNKHDLMQIDRALLKIHDPPDSADIVLLNEARDNAHHSLVFEEFFMLQAGLALRASAHKEELDGIEFSTSPKIRETLKQMLPFRLTDGQRKAFREIVEDMTSLRPMRRLIQGDVGCGKTIVALLAAALAIENGYQAAFMVPTEILAEQHLQAVKRHLAHTNYRIGFLSSSLSIKDRGKVRKKIAGGELDLIVGTHALIQEGVHYNKLGLAIVDEQHRFGVLQRARLLKLASGTNPDMLIMTATPIPRSLTLTLFGDLSVSLIKDMPPGRQPVLTAVRTDKNRNRINAFLESQMKEGRQFYAVAPVIEESKNGELKTAKELYERLRKAFPGRRIGLLHGRIPAAEREAVMNDFVAGKLDALACTTVIEVGVDVPNATVMFIENAERFGLAQLHQLRGRVGRGRYKSYCILMHQKMGGDPARKRLQIMVKTSDGFEIAEKDLEIRGPGDFFGTRQSGLPSLRVGNIVRDVELLQKARKVAFEYMADNSPELAEEKQAVIGQIRKQWERRYGLVLIG